MRFSPRPGALTLLVNLNARARFTLILNRPSACAKAELCLKINRDRIRFCEGWQPLARFWIPNKRNSGLSIRLLSPLRHSLNMQLDHVAKLSAEAEECWHRSALDTIVETLAQGACSVVQVAEAMAIDEDFLRKPRRGAVKGITWAPCSIGSGVQISPVDQSIHMDRGGVRSGTISASFRCSSARSGVL